MTISPSVFTIAVAVVLLCCAAQPAAALRNGMGLTPPLGWSTWCGLGPCGNDYCNEAYVMQAATAMQSNGMQSHGYHWVLLDDCWAATSRTPTGQITWDTDRFPHGIPFLVDWLHMRNFSFGLYTSSGNVTCSSGGRPLPVPGSEHHYQEDVDTFASWEVDYVKFDWCGDVHNLPFDGIAVGAKDYKAISAAMTNSTPARPMYLEGVAAMIFLLSEVPTYMNAWRASTDHHDNWGNTNEVIDTVEILSFPSSPGAWSYMDVLMTGGQGCQSDDRNSSVHCPGMTNEEYRAEYTLWSLYQSPLIVSTDVRNMTPIMNELLLHSRILEIHQDTRTPPGKRVGYSQTTGCESDLFGFVCQLFARPLHDGTVLAALYNAADTAKNLTLPFTKVSGWSATTTATVEDLWGNAGNVTAAVVGSFAATVNSHSAVYVVLHPKSA